MFIKHSVSSKLTLVFAYLLLLLPFQAKNKRIYSLHWMQAIKSEPLCDWNHILHIFWAFYCKKFKPIPVLFAYANRAYVHFNCTVTATFHWTDFIYFFSSYSSLSLFFQTILFLKGSIFFACSNSKLNLFGSFGFEVYQCFFWKFTFFIEMFWFPSNWHLLLFILMLKNDVDILPKWQTF